MSGGQCHLTILGKFSWPSLAYMCLKGGLKKTLILFHLLSEHTFGLDYTKNAMNRALGHFCTHIGQTGTRETPEVGEMNEMTLSSRHRIRNSSPGGLRPTTLPLGHGGSPQYEFYTWMGKKHFCFFQTAETGNRTPNSDMKGSSANHYPRASPL